MNHILSNQGIKSDQLWLCPICSHTNSLNDHILTLGNGIQIPCCIQCHTASKHDGDENKLLWACFHCEIGLTEWIHISCQFCGKHNNKIPSGTKISVGNYKSNISTRISQDRENNESGAIVKKRPLQAQNRENFDKVSSIATTDSEDKNDLIESGIEDIINTQKVPKTSSESEVVKIALVIDVQREAFDEQLELLHYFNDCFQII